MSFLQTKEQLALLLSVVSGGVGYEKETEYSGKGGHKTPVSVLLSLSEY